ncbi:hypothetical protein BGX38DRAFT_824638 [Terfezia claveryi]|nr:hypothetical protein BGX38DRAFT_824638 [Terfezia claveryi]
MPGQYVTMKEPRQPKPPKEPKPKKEKPPPKRKRSPSPPINEADFPPEALLKPNSSYLFYSRSYLKFREEDVESSRHIQDNSTKIPLLQTEVTTTGWQSSVRHNLSQSSAFERVQREGKGWLWKITEGFNIEKEKKKKLLPPPPLSQIIHSHYGQMVPVSNGMAPVPWNGMHGQQGVPFQNGVYMAPPRPPGGPVAAPGFPNQPQMAQGGSIQAQYLIQPAQYQQPQQHPTTPVPNAQPFSTIMHQVKIRQCKEHHLPQFPPSRGRSLSTAICCTQSSNPPPPVSNATRIQMASLLLNSHKSSVLAKLQCRHNPLSLVLP